MEFPGSLNRWYILPIGGLYATYHLLREPETTIELLLEKSSQLWINPFATSFATSRFTASGKFAERIERWVLRSTGILPKPSWTKKGQSTTYLLYKILTTANRKDKIGLKPIAFKICLGLPGKRKTCKAQLCLVKTLPSENVGLFFPHVPWSKNGYEGNGHLRLLLLMGEILHRLIGSISHYLQGYSTIPSGSGFQPSTVGMAKITSWISIRCLVFTRYCTPTGGWKHFWMTPMGSPHPFWKTHRFKQRHLNWLVVEPTHLKKYAEVKLDHFPNFRGEHKKYLKFHHLVKETKKTLSQKNHLVTNVTCHDMASVANLRFFVHLLWKQQHQLGWLGLQRNHQPE